MPPPPSVVSLRRHPWVHSHQNHDNPYLSMSSECHRAWSQHWPQRPTGRRRPQTRAPSLRFSAAELNDSFQVSSTFKAAADGQGEVLRAAAENAHISSDLPHSDSGIIIIIWWVKSIYLLRVCSLTLFKNIHRVLLKYVLWQIRIPEIWSCDANFQS